MAVADEQPGGDAVCWLHELCPACGAVPSTESPDRCWRCGDAGGAAAERDTGAAGPTPTARSE